MSLGVIALWHWSGLAPRGMMKAIWDGQPVFRLQGIQLLTCLHTANPQRKADTQVVAVGPFDREDSVGDEKEDTERQDSDTDPAGDIDSFRNI